MTCNFSLKPKVTLLALITSLAAAGDVAQNAEGLPVNNPNTVESSPLECKNYELQSKLAFIDDVKAFGVEQIGLEENLHYTKYADNPLPTDTLYLLLVTSPVHLPESRNSQVVLIPSDQNYRVALNGFAYFQSSADKLDDEKEYYQQQGYDVYRRFTTDYSLSSGLWGSPITKEFLQRKKIHQAQTIFHENCHYWVAGRIGGSFSSELNESFCEVVGYAGAADYFRERKGISSPDYLDAAKSFQNYQKFSQKVNAFYSRLQEIYNHKKSTPGEKLKLREEVFGEAKKVLGEDTNNATLWDRYPYTKYFPLMLKFHESQGGNLRATLEKMKDCPEEEKAALKYIEKNRGSNKEE